MRSGKLNSKTARPVPKISAEGQVMRRLILLFTFVLISSVLSLLLMAGYIYEVKEVYLSPGPKVYEKIHSETYRPISIDTKKHFNYSQEFGSYSSLEITRNIRRQEKKGVENLQWILCKL